MRLAFLYQPVKDFDTALAFYRDMLGLDESWREGDTTVAFTLPGTEIEIMVDQTSGADTGPGGFFMIDSVDQYRSEHPDLDWAGETIDVPDGRVATFRDPSGNSIHLCDQSAAEAG